MADKHFSLGVTVLHQTQPQTERTQCLLHVLVLTNQQQKRNSLDQSGMTLPFKEMAFRGYLLFIFKPQSPTRDQSPILNYGFSWYVWRGIKFSLKTYS
jgi:hypothetical protein